MCLDTGVVYNRTKINSSKNKMNIMQQKFLFSFISRMFDSVLSPIGISLKSGWFLVAPGLWDSMMMVFAIIADSLGFKRYIYSCRNLLRSSVSPSHLRLRPVLKGHQSKMFEEKDFDPEVGVYFPSMDKWYCLVPLCRGEVVKVKHECESSY